MGSKPVCSLPSWGLPILGVDAASALGGLFGRQVFTVRALAIAPATICVLLTPKSAMQRLKALSSRCGTISAGPSQNTPTSTNSTSKVQDRGSKSGISDVVDRTAHQGKGILFVSGHFANWEIMPIAATGYGFDGELFTARSTTLTSIAGW